MFVSEICAVFHEHRVEYNFINAFISEKCAFLTVMCLS